MKRETKLLLIAWTGVLAFFYTLFFQIDFWQNLKYEHWAIFPTAFICLAINTFLLASFIGILVWRKDVLKNLDKK